MDKKFLILGGDERSLYLGEYLENKGLNICYYGFSDTDCFKSLNEAMGSSDCIILPLPFTRDRITLNTPLFNEKIKISDILSLSDKTTFFFGGKLTKCFTEELTVKNIDFYDYFTSEELAIYNAVPTAEGVLGILINELPVTVRNMKCAVLGYGKVGKAIANTLKSLNADVKVFCRSEKAAAECFMNSVDCENFGYLKKTKYDFDAVINTVPETVLKKDELINLKPDCILLEVASPPYGIDFEAAKENGLKVINAPSLPGKTSPKTAGEIIGKTILPIFKQKGLIV